MQSEKELNMKEIKITEEQFYDIATDVAAEMGGLTGLLHLPFIAKLSNKLFGKEETTKQPLEELKDGFKPHLRRGNEFLGFIGEPTPLTALDGEPLFVGDLVEKYAIDKDESYGTSNVCKTEEGYFVMGLMTKTLNDLKNGTKDEWRFTKVKSYKDLVHNEEYEGYVTAILKEVEDENRK